MIGEGNRVSFLLQPTEQHIISPITEHNLEILLADAKHSWSKAHCLAKPGPPRSRSCLTVQACWTLTASVQFTMLFALWCSGCGL